MKKVGIKFKTSGKVYDFNSGAFVLNVGDVVVPQQWEPNGSRKPLKKVYRLANEKDFDQRDKNLTDEKEAHEYCLKCLNELGLKMNLFSVEKSFDLFFHLRRTGGLSTTGKNAG